MDGQVGGGWVNEWAGGWWMGEWVGRWVVDG